MQLADMKSHVPAQHSQYRVGCSPSCVGNPVNDGTCHPSAGCCQLEIPRDVKSTKALFDLLNNNSQIRREYPCNYVTVMDKKAFKFSTTYLTSTAFYDTYNTGVPVVMKWGITNKKCKDPKILKNGSDACVSNNSECTDTDAGYACKCSKGYEGNPYLINGCKGSSPCPIFFCAKAFIL